MPENKIRSVKQKPFTPPTTSPTELTTYIGTPPRFSFDGGKPEEFGSGPGEVEVTLFLAGPGCAYAYWPWFQGEVVPVDMLVGRVGLHRGSSHDG